MVGQSIRAQILANLDTALKITGSSYHYDVEASGAGSVQTWKQEGTSLVGSPAITYYWTADERQGDEVSGYGLMNRTLHVVVDGWIQESDAGGATALQVEQMVSDIEKASMVDKTRGGKAVTTRIMGSDPFASVEGQGHAGCSVRLQILYKVRDTDPEIQ